jgi:hypothetical protein
MKKLNYREISCVQCGVGIKSYFKEQNVCSSDCRFYKYQNTSDIDACWEWSGPVNPCGYGVLFLNVDKQNGRRNVISAHRYSYIKYKGEIPKDMCVMHKCDNPKCTNPNHLSLGTFADNNKDRSLKGRSGARVYSQEEKDTYSKRYMGEGNPSNKLSEVQAREIKYDRSLGCVRAAKKYGVSPSLIKRIRRGLVWVHI